jgi:predicted Zn finger-like uncharacterized protein
MFTRCPNCHTIFRVSDDQLRAADGKVCCGQCRTVFDARAALLDQSQPQRDEQASRAAPTADFETAEPFFADDTDTNDTASWPTESEPEYSEDASSHEGADNDITNSADEPQVNGLDQTKPLYETWPASGPKQEDLWDADEGWSAEPGNAQPDTPELEWDAEPAQPEPVAATENSESPASPGPLTETEEVPEALEDDFRASFESQSTWATFGWAVAAILLSIALAAQYLNHARHELAQNDRFRPWITSYCDLVGCEVPLKKDLAKLRLLTRGVTINPDKGNVLIIQATIVNTAEQAQPYPILQVKLSNNQGIVVAMRRFKPNEYLENMAKIRQGMPPETPLSLMLQVMQPQRPATNYQFDFL